MFYRGGKDCLYDVPWRFLLGCDGCVCGAFFGQVSCMCFVASYCEGSTVADPPLGHHSSLRAALYVVYAANSNPLTPARPSSRFAHMSRSIHIIIIASLDVRCDCGVSGLSGVSRLSVDVNFVKSVSALLAAGTGGMQKVEAFEASTVVAVEICVRFPCRCVQ